MTAYEQQAKDFLELSETTMRIIRIGEVIGFPFDKKDKNKHYKYQIILKREDKMYDFPFYDSFSNFLKDKRPTPYDVLSCIEKYEPYGDVFEFADEFGYPLGSKEDFHRTETIFRNCKEQYESLLDFFGEELMQKLQEIA